MDGLGSAVEVVEGTQVVHFHLIMHWFASKLNQLQADLCMVSVTLKE